jgi:hypothetical protein
MMLYNAMVTDAGHIFLPTGFEVLGAWNGHTRKMLVAIKRESHGRLTMSDAAASVGVSIQRSNAEIVRRAYAADARMK